MKKSIYIVGGTRPEAIKLFPIIYHLKSSAMPFIFIWSGQHYDYEMSRIFFEEIGIRPDYELGVGSGTQGVQVAKIIQSIEDFLGRTNEKGILVAVGDTNTVLGASLAASKMGWIFAHVEAGLRSFDRYMPEEINRLVADHVANIMFAPSTQAVLNLLYEGLDPWRIYLTGNTIVDAVKMISPRVEKERDRVLSELGVEEPYALVTLHRAENVDHADRLGRILKSFKDISREIQLIFPLHPRTRKRIEEFGLDKLLSGIKVIKPLGYFEFLSLLSKAEVVFTDSGGVQEEAFTLNVPCITLRRNTERPETVWLGGNILVGDDPERIINAYKYVRDNRGKIVEKIRLSNNPYGDGKAGERITNILKLLVEDYEFFKKYAYDINNEPDYRDLDYPNYIVINGSAFEGITIKDFHEKFPGTYITLIYDEKGRPVIPYSDIVIKGTWKLRVWGPRKILEFLVNTNR